ncbi:F-box/FBD/LRR-repeat protein At1g13570-like [Rutidosis leptorrhynchoides]|uniref:F-box/FBD/LRR-repeat protein At1g13570-like n=1 Tax=Rutidosis leptorrhynchoides TaxID=125765 RepID=UPI003A98D82E
MMKTQCMSLDIISSLPQNIMETILTLMPIRDALRTSILSRKWRYCWMTMPKLVFDYNLIQALAIDGILVQYKFVIAIFHILLMHSGPTMLKFEFDVDKWSMVTEFDQIILYLSRRINVKDLSIDTLDTFYKLPTSFYSMQGLESLELINCEFELPLTFNGFNKLKKMSFEKFQVPAQVLQRLLSNSPLLEIIRLMEFDYDEEDFEEDYEKENSFNFVKFFECVPLVHTLDLSEYYMKYLSAGGMPSKLSTSHLKYVRLDVCLREQDGISSALCIIRSSPNLERIFLQMCGNEKLPYLGSCNKFVDLQDDLNLQLDHLIRFEIVRFSNSVFEMEFVKLIVAKSPVLKIARIELNENVSIDEELKLLRDAIYLPFPRASPSTKLIIERPKF